MSQTNYNFNMASAYAGMKADSRFDLVETFIAETEVPFGRGVGSESGSSYVNVPKKDVALIALSTALIASNSTIVTINGNATTATVYATSHNATMNAIKAKIEALAGVTSVTLTDATNNLEFTVETEGVVISAAAAVTLGDSQPTVTVTLSSDDIFRGIAIHTHNQNGKYIANDAVNVLRQGVVWVETGVAVNEDEDAYVDLAGGIGKFTNVSSGNLATGGKFRSTVGSAGLAKVNINLP